MSLKEIRTIAVLGDGGWGTTLAVHLAKKNYKVKLWGAFPEYVQEVQRKRINPKFLPGIKIPKQVEMVDRLDVALNSVQIVILAVPSQYILGILKKLKPFDLSGKMVLSVIKGIDPVSLKRISELILGELGKVKLAVLSGPTIAMETARGLPTTAVIASPDSQMARILQGVLNSEKFRIYTNSDVVGVELGGSIKNIIAIACGVCDGLGFGTNAKAAIVTRGLAEMTRLGTAMGAQSKTFSGLTGLGDLVTTCFSPQSRNRCVGEKLGKGISIKQITSKMDMVAEGVETVKAVYRLGQKYRISLPITNEVFQIIYKNKNPKRAVNDLMNRRVKSEF